MNVKNLFKPDARFSRPGYRADIDGLRTVAIALVILYHLGIPLITGGYVGVDVFFVISGFLMTSIVVRGHEKGTFSFQHFYEHRLRRIVPSLFALLIVATIGSTLVLSMGDLVQFGNSMGASLLFAANIFFFTHSGYFDADISSKPLVHLWSLGVEGQFYLIWPIILLFALRRLRTLQVYILVGVLAVLSLACAVAFAQSPDTATAGFYLLPSRFIEFLFGAAIVWMPVYVSKADDEESEETAKTIADGSFIGGLAAIGLSAFVYNVQTPFPSFYALLPCLGAAAVIYGGRSSQLRLLLANPVMAYLGRISYELYLFHWVVIVFYHMMTPESVGPIHAAVMVILTFVLAMFTYHFISCPLRYGFQKDSAQRHHFLIGCTASFALLCVLVLSMSLSGGWAWRLSPAARMFVEDPEKFHATQYGGIAFHENTLHTLGDKSSPPQFLLIGDSFAGQYAGALDQFLTAHHKSAYLYYVNGCLFTPHATVHMQGKQTSECTDALGKFQALLQGNHLPVIQAQSWSSYKEGVLSNGQPLSFTTANNNDYYQFIMSGVDQMHTALVGHKYLFVGIAPGIQEHKSIATCFAAPTIIHTHCAAGAAGKEEDRQNGQEFNLAAASYAGLHPDVTFLNPRLAMCHDGMCYAITDTKIFYSDYSHFTTDGALEVLNHYQDILLGLHP